MMEFVADKVPKPGKVLQDRTEPPAAVRAELDRILTSQAFARAERPSRFLTFLVEHTLDGSGSGITEYILATEIFNRKPDFDPAQDPIVRVEAGRLRRKLKEYYETEGGDDPLVIDLPQRTYVPVFLRQQEAPPVLQAIRRPVRRRWRVLVAVALGILAGIALQWVTRPSNTAQAAASQTGSIVVLHSSNHEVRAGGPLAPVSGARSVTVLPFNDLSAGHDQEFFCDGLTDELAEQLDDIDGLNLVARSSAFRFKGRPDDVRAIGKQLNAGLVLEGSVRKDGRRLRVSAQLVNTDNGYRTWSQTYIVEGNDPVKAQEQLARRIVTAVAPLIRK